jgi:hypothetical protein
MPFGFVPVLILMHKAFNMMFWQTFHVLFISMTYDPSDIVVYKGFYIVEI